MFKKPIIFHILYTIAAPLFPVCLKPADFYKAPPAEKLPDLPADPVCFHWPNSSSVCWKCNAH